MTVLDLIIRSLYDALVVSPAGRMGSPIPRSGLGSPSFSVKGKNDLDIKTTVPELDINKALFDSL